MKGLRVTWNLNDLTLGQLWDVDLQKNESLVKDVILVAQGEKALEEFLRQVFLTAKVLFVNVVGGVLIVSCLMVCLIKSSKVREAWQTYMLDLVNYQNKCKLIRGWDDLFTKVKEHINSVTAMKLSPYYKVTS